MRAMILHNRGDIESNPLRLEDIATPTPGAGELLVKVHACGVCRTDLHVIEGDIARGPLPIIPGHQIVGTVVQVGSKVDRTWCGTRVGIAWLHQTCGSCEFCRADAENLCLASRYTGYDVNGGFAEYCTVPEEYAYRIPEEIVDEEVAPLLCAGIIGFRAIKRSRIKQGERIALYGFGSSAHLAIQILLSWKCHVFVISRDAAHREMARSLGAAWIGDGSSPIPYHMHSAIIFAPAGELVLHALANLRAGGTVVTAGIHLSDIPAINYQAHIFHEKTLTSVESNTRHDGSALLALARSIPIRAEVQIFPLDEANRVLQLLKNDKISGTAILKI